MVHDDSGHVYCVMPLFNRLPSTLECVRCLRTQTYHPLTIIAVDGGSTDGTQAQLGAEHPDVVLLEGEKLWWGGATRLGIAWALSHSAGEDDFIMLVNNDTTFDPHYVETVVAHCRRNTAAICGVVVDADQSDRVIDAGVNLDWYGYHFRGLYQIPADRQPKLDCCVLPGRATVVPIHAVRKAGNVDADRFPHYLSDYEFSYRLRKKGGIRLGVAYDAEVRTTVETSEAREGNAWDEFRTIVVGSFSRRSKRNILDHYRFIDTHAPVELRWRLKLLLLYRHVRRMSAFSPVARVNRMVTLIIGPFTKAARLAFGTYLIPRADIQLLNLDMDRLLAEEIITESRHPGFYFASRPKGYLRLQYPEALELYGRARNPFRKVARFVQSRHSDMAVSR